VVESTLDSVGGPALCLHGEIGMIFPAELEANPSVPPTVTTLVFRIAADASGGAWITKDSNKVAHLTPTP
jgi:hypothetical protein